MKTTANIAAKSMKDYMQIHELGYELKGSELRRIVRSHGMDGILSSTRLTFTSCTISEKQNWFTKIAADTETISKAWEMNYGCRPVILFFYGKSGKVVGIRLQEISRKEYDNVKPELINGIALHYNAI